MKMISLAIDTINQNTSDFVILQLIPKKPIKDGRILTQHNKYN